MGSGIARSARQGSPRETEEAVRARRAPTDDRGRLDEDASTPRGPVGQLLQLQGTVGNAAVARLVGQMVADRRSAAQAGRAVAPLLFARPTSDWRQDGDEEEMIFDQHDGGVASVADAGVPTAAGVSVGPIAVRNGPLHSPINTATMAGMEIAITVTSSSGVDADMAAIQDSEQVSLSYAHTGSFATMPPTASSTSSWMPGFPIPNDRHGTPKSMVIDRADNNGGDGQFDKDQLDIFTAPAAGVTAPTAIPASGYRIRRIIKTSGTSIVLRTEKCPLAVTVNGFTSTAGPSPVQADEVTVRA